MKAYIYEVIIKQFLAFVGLNSAEAWDKAKELVKQAAEQFANLTGAERRQFVVDELKKVYPTVASFLCNFLVEAAFAFLKAKAIIA